MKVLSLESFVIHGIHNILLQYIAAKIRTLFNAFSVVKQLLFANIHEKP